MKEEEKKKVLRTLFFWGLAANRRFEGKPTSPIRAGISSPNLPKKPLFQLDTLGES
jgi:hypothetical protein